MTKVIKLTLLALSFATLQQENAVAADFPMVDEQENSKWTLTLDEGYKPLGEYSSFMLFEPSDKGKILRIRLNVWPSKPSIANVFSDEDHQNNSPIAIMESSGFALGLVAANDVELNKAKEIICSINNRRQEEHNAYVTKKKAEEALAGKKRFFSIWDSVEPVLPFTFLNIDQANCFMASVDFDNYKDLGEFITQFQVTYPELKSRTLLDGYAEFARRIEHANTSSAKKKK